MTFAKKALFTILTLSLLAFALAACQSKPEGPQIEISEAWGRPSPLQAGNGAAYMTIENKGSEDDVLISAASDVAEAVELHDMTMEDNVMKMFRVESIEIPADGSAELKPGGKHVMFIGLYNQLEVGQVITVTLEFEKSGTRTIEVEIREP